MIYLITLICNSSFYGLIGAYSIIKKDVQDELDLETSFLGLVDSLSFMGRLFGFIYLIFSPSMALKKDFLISSVITTFCFLLIPLATYISFLSKILLIIAFFFSGFYRVYIIVPYLIVSQYFDPVNKDKAKIAIWYSIQGMGDVFAVLLTVYLTRHLYWSWESALIANIAFFFFFSFLMYIICEEVKMDEEVIASERGTTEIIHFSDDEGHLGRFSLSRESRKTEIMEEAKSLMVFFRKNTGNLLWLIDYSLMSTFYYCIICWFPFYFMKLGL